MNVTDSGEDASVYYACSQNGLIEYSYSTQNCSGDWTFYCSSVRVESGCNANFTNGENGGDYTTTEDAGDSDSSDSVTTDSSTENDNTNNGESNFHYITVHNLFFTFGMSLIINIICLVL